MDDKIIKKDAELKNKIFNSDDIQTVEVFMECALKYKNFGKALTYLNDKYQSKEFFRMAMVNITQAKLKDAVDEAYP